MSGESKRTPSLTEYVSAQVVPQTIKLACFDIDGTLLSLDGNYSERLKTSIQRIQGLGVKTAIASGRPYFATRFLWDELNLSDAGVYCTGAQIFEPKKQLQHKNHYLPKPILSGLVERLREANIYYELYTDNGFYVEQDNAPEVLKVHASHLRVQPTFRNFDEVNEPVIKLLVGADLEKDSDILQTLEDAFPECVFAYAALPAYPQWLFASIVCKSADKSSAFEYLLEYYNITAQEVISFGDAQSDMVFLSKAGVGVAMGNAKPEVKAIADLVTDAVWDDGVAKALDALVTEPVYVGEV